MILGSSKGIEASEKKKWVRVVNMRPCLPSGICSKRLIRLSRYRLPNSSLRDMGHILGSTRDVLLM